MQPQAKVLIIDDEEDVREILTRWLRGKGYQCSAAASGEEALELLGREAFEVLLCDVRMPGLSGIEVLGQVKERDPLAVVIMVTAVNQVDTAVAAMQRGAYDYIVKPFDLGKLASQLQEGLQWRREQQRQAVALSTREARLMESALEAVRVFMQTSDAVPEVWREHSEAVMDLAVAVTQRLGLSRLDTSIVAWAAIQHHVGKMTAHSSRGQGHTQERAMVVAYQDGANDLMIEPLFNDRRVLEAIKYMDSRFDGLGRGQRLRGREIPVVARVLAVAHAFVTMGQRSSPDPAQVQAILHEMEQESGKRFDPQVVEVLAQVVNP
ncbi:MAG: response regulator [Dehalococcoidia bacterium]